MPTWKAIIIIINLAFSRNSGSIPCTNYKCLSWPRYTIYFSYACTPQDDSCTVCDRIRIREESYHLIVKDWAM